MFLFRIKGKIHRSIIKLPWELVNQFTDVITKSINGDDGSEDEDELEAYKDSIQRLKEADDVTRAMTREEYVHYSECRQASFTYRKSRRFREWASMSSYVDMKPNDDIVESLGFLTYEMVSKLTTTAIQIKRDQLEAEGKKENEPMSLGKANLKRKREDEDNTNNDSGAPSVVVTTAEGSMSTPKPGENTTEKGINEEEKHDSPESPDSPDSDCLGLFSLPSTEQTPLQAEHIYEAFRRLQQVPHPMKNFRGSLVRNRISLI